MNVGVLENALIISQRMHVKVTNAVQIIKNVHGFKKMKRFSLYPVIIPCGIRENTIRILKILLLFTLITNFIDAILSLKFINFPTLSDYNPLMYYLLEHSRVSFIFIKGLLIPFFILTIFKYVTTPIGIIGTFIVSISYMIVLYAWVQVMF